MPSLYDSVLQIAKEMEAEGDNLEKQQALHDAALHHRISRRLLKVLAECGRETPQLIIPTSSAQAEDAKKLAQKEESSSTHMTVLVGGEDDGVMVPIDASMPVGAYTQVSGQKYQLQDDRRLHLIPS